MINQRRNNIMSVQDNKVLIQQYVEAISGKDKTADVVAPYVSDEGLQHHIEIFEAAFPRYEFIPSEMVAEEDRVAVHFTAKAVHQGELMGIPPTGRSISIEGIIIYHIAGGKIVGHKLVADQLSLMQQLGVIPAGETA
jgi:predicted ester cyclase